MFSRVEIKNGFVNEFGLEIAGASYYICDGLNVKSSTTYPDDPDVANLPTKTVGIGSRALCITTGNIYILGPSKVWMKYKGVSIMN